jgi:polysaccharide export outer membrane protein
VAGKTTAQVEHEIAEKLKGGYIREPKVTVEIDTYRPFFILGEVTNSGQFPYVNGMTVQTAVAIAGGYTPRAAKDYAELTRQTPRGLLAGVVPITYPVRPGDTIVIKERWF